MLIGFCGVSIGGICSLVISGFVSILYEIVR